MCRLRINMGEIDAMIRFYIAIFFMVLGVFSGLYPLLIIAIILIFTAIKRRCFIYSLLGINKKIQSDTYYKNLYMKNIENIIILLNEDDEILYSNRVESHMYLKEIFDLVENQIFEIDIDNQSYTIVYSSIQENQIRVIELKK